MSVTVSIVSYNTQELLKKILKSLENISKKVPLEIWVVDNASTDSSVQMVETDFPKVHLIKNPKNLGFGKAHNQILKKLNSTYALLLNPDTEIPQDAINKMVKFMEENPDCGISSCRLTGFNGELQSNGGDLPFGLGLLSWLFNLESLGNLPSFHRLDQEYYRTKREVGWVGGTFMFIRSKAIKRAGLFNEDYFMYFEDVEFCINFKKAGYKVMVNPEVVVKHHSGASFKNPNYNQWKGEFSGLISFYSKHYGYLVGLLMRFLVYLGIALRVIAFNVVGRREAAKNYAKVLFSI